MNDMTASRSEVIDTWARIIEKAAPPAICVDNDRWVYLLTLATKSDYENERVEIILNWAWDMVGLSAAHVENHSTNQGCFEYRLRPYVESDLMKDLWISLLKKGGSAPIVDVVARSTAEAVAHLDKVAILGTYDDSVWGAIDPIGLLERLIKIGANDD